MADKPASRPIAKAVPLRNGPGFRAQFALPGLIPDYVSGHNGIQVYSSELQAENAARAALFRVLVARTTDTRRAGWYKRLTGAGLAVLLNDAELTPTHFAEIYGVPQSRVMKWLDGEQDIPHSAHVLIKLLCYEENFKEARSITDWAQNEGDDDGHPTD